MNATRIAVIGAGHGGTSMAAHLAKMGAEVNLYDLFPEYISGIQKMGGINLEGVCGSGFVRLNKVTEDLKEALTGVELIMVVTPSFTHRLFANACCEYLEDGQVIVLNPGRTGGALEFLKILRDKGLQKQITVAETQTLIYACRKKGPASATIYGIKNEVMVASIPASNIERVTSLLGRYYSQFKGVENVLYTSLGNIGAVVHPAPVIMNIGRIETPNNSFKYYMEGITPTVATLLEKVDGERRTVANAVGIKLDSVQDWLKKIYNTSGKNLYELMQNNEAYKGIMGPETVNVRYITEDVPMSLVPISELGRKFGVVTPVIDTIIDVACAIYERDFRKEGRTLDKLGLDCIDNSDIVGYCASGFADCI